MRRPTKSKAHERPQKRVDNQGHRFESKQHRSKSAFAELLMKPMCIRNLLHRFPLSNSCNAEAVWCFRPMQNNPSPTSRCCPVSKRRPRLTIEPLMSPCISQPLATFPPLPSEHALLCTYLFPTRTPSALAASTLSSRGHRPSRIRIHTQTEHACN